MRIQIQVWSLLRLLFLLTSILSSTGKYKAYLHWNKNIFFNEGSIKNISIKKIYLCPLYGFWTQIRIHIANMNPDPDSGESINANPCASGTGSRTLNMTVHDMKNPPVLSPGRLHSCPWIWTAFLFQKKNSEKLPSFCIIWAHWRLQKTGKETLTLSLALNY